MFHFPKKSMDTVSPFPPTQRVRKNGKVHFPEVSRFVPCPSDALQKLPTV